MEIINKHKEYFNKDKVEVPSVTTILKILNKPNLIGWANGLGFKRKNVKEVLKESASIGTELHDMIANYTSGNKSYICDTPAVYTLFDLFLDWEKSNNFKPLLIEHGMACKFFGGTIDSVCFINNKVTLLDYKTSKSIYPSMFLQLAGYMILLKENNKELYDEIQQVGILSISEKKKIQEKYIPKSKIEEEYIPIFLTIVKLFHYWHSLNLNDWNINILE